MIAPLFDIDHHRKGFRSGRNNWRDPEMAFLARGVFAGAGDGPVVQLHLRERGVLGRCPSIRQTTVILGGGERVAMVAALQNEVAVVTAVWITALAIDGLVLPIDRPTQMVGAYGRSALRLGRAGETLTLAATLDDALAAHAAGLGPVWCSFGASRLYGEIEPPLAWCSADDEPDEQCVFIPDSVDRLRIVTDDCDVAALSTEYHGRLGRIVEVVPTSSLVRTKNVRQAPVLEEA